MVSELQPPTSDKHVLVEIEDACHIIRKAKPTIYTLVRKGLLPAYKKGKKLYFYEDELLWLGLRTGVERLPSKHTRRCWQICRAVSVISPNHP